MTPAEPWREEFAEWARDLAPEDREAARALLDDVGPARQPTREERDAVAARWAFLRRWPIEMRLGVLRILRELDEQGVLHALRDLQRDDPDTYGALVAELRGEG